MAPVLRVLVVDDSAVVRQGVLMLLERVPGMAVEVASDPLIARQKMKGQRPDVILLDLEMPRMDGLTFLRELPKVFRGAHVDSPHAQFLRGLDALVRGAVVDRLLALGPAAGTGLAVSAAPATGGPARSAAIASSSRLRWPNEATPASRLCGR